MASVVKTLFAFFFLSEHWKRVFAWVLVYGYTYNVAAWGLIHWGVNIGTMVTGHQIPGPPLLPWEQLAVMTANLAVIGGIQVARERQAGIDRATPEA